MNEQEVRQMGDLEDDHWWFVGKLLILGALLEGTQPGRLLDLGCGTGGVLADWSESSRCTGTDASALALQICRDRGLTELARADLTALPFAAESFETVVALDVIEHLDDDVDFLRGAARLCAPGGRLLVSVPAFQLLWSQHDVTFEHRRRYTAQQLERVIRGAGLSPERITYTNFFVFPLAAAWRIAGRRLGLGRFAPRSDFLPVPRFVNELLVRVYALESWLLRRANLPFGVSVACVARRPEAA